MEHATPLSILVVDDDESFRNALNLSLTHAEFAPRLAASPREALQILQNEAFDTILCDIQMPGMNGFDFIREARALAPDAAIIAMTGFGSADVAMQALRAGAYDYLAKPFEFEELVLTIRKIEERERLRAENAELRSVISQRYNFGNIISQSPQMQRVFETVKRLSNFHTTVLICGESGTGKELLARALHHNSPRRGKPFVAINCGAIPEHLMESELFGHRRGSFTDATRDKRGLFEEAHTGTVFLDEIGEMPLHLQVKLLRVLQEQQIRRVGDEQMIPVDVRVIAATLRNLDDDVRAGRFRDDLYYRLNVVTIELPPLRERTEDIPVLAEHFIKKHNKRLSLQIKGISPDALKALTRYYWKGNVRELENCIERAMVLSDSDSIDLNSLPDHVRESSTIERSPFDTLDESNLSIKQHSRALEISLIRKALRKTRGNRTHAAKILEISHRALLYKLKEYGLAESPAEDQEGEQ